MKIDVISDLHLDSWVNKNKGKWLNAFIDKIIPDERSNTLVIAGDLSHKNTQTVNAVKYLTEFYENIVIVAGNHDHYIIYNDLIDKYGDSHGRVSDLKNRLDKIDGVHFLQKESVEIEGITYAGCTGWYDGKYSELEIGTPPGILDNMWTLFADARYIFTSDGTPFKWKAEHEEHRAFLDEATSYADVIVTHHIPIWEKMRDLFRSSPFTSFFHFNGYPLTHKFKGKAWIYGHTHDHYVYDYDGCKMICNPLGYEGEFFNGHQSMEKLPRMIRTIEI